MSCTCGGKVCHVLVHHREVSREGIVWGYKIAIHDIGFEELKVSMELGIK